MKTTRKLCVGCDEYKVKVLGSRNDQGRKRYVNEHNATWSANLCPDCKVVRNTSQTVAPRKVRHCRECKEVLPATRYFHHELCVSDEFCPSTDVYGI